jgi:hypothetical protein
LLGCLDNVIEVERERPSLFAEQRKRHGEKYAKEFESKTKNPRANYSLNCRNELLIFCSSTISSPSEYANCLKNEGFLKFRGRIFNVHLFCFCSERT